MTELLAPAGNKEAFLAALCAGADAVYIGGQKYGARAYADNFDQESLIWAIDTAHLYGKKIYMTINTLMKQTELDALASYLTPFYQVGLDGIIVQDFGALVMMKKMFPETELHASTQMTVTGSRGAKLLKENGIMRVVPARELSLREIIKIKEEAGVEVETFIHGAMCYAYSGQCLFSSMLGQRSGNRGRCAGPCRLPYKAFYNDRQLNDSNSLYQLSLKDLCSLDIIPDLMDAGIDSFKIEGRMKSKEYVSFVTGLYRYYMDAYQEDPRNYHVDQKDKKNLQNMFSRGSIETGYYFAYNGRHLVTLQKPGYRTFSTDENETVSHEGIKQDFSLKIPLTAFFYAHKEEALSLTVMTMDEDVKSVTVTGDLVKQSQNRPALKEEILKALHKTGNTAFSFQLIEVDMENDVFLPNKELNELRRRAISLLTEEILQKHRREEKTKNHGNCSVYQINQNNQAIKFSHTHTTAPGLIIRIQNMSQLSALSCPSKVNKVLLSWDCFEEGTIDFQDFKRKINAIKQKNISVGLSLCAVTREKTISLYDRYRDKMISASFDEFVVNNLESLAYMKEKFPNTKLISDSRFYVFQQESLGFFEKFGVTEHFLSYELHEKEMKPLIENGFKSGHHFAIPAYGYIPVMESAGCILKTNGQCEKDKTGKTYFIDRQQKKLPVIRHCSNCENTIYNAVPLSLHKEINKLTKMGAENLILSFTIESGQMMNRMIDWYDRLLSGNVCEPFISEFTKGHFAKGVE